jgi:hypothetical protein
VWLQSALQIKAHFMTSAGKAGARPERKSHRHDRLVHLDDCHRDDCYLQEHALQHTNASHGLTQRYRKD